MGKRQWRWSKKRRIRKTYSYESMYRMALIITLPIGRNRSNKKQKRRSKIETTILVLHENKNNRVASKLVEGSRIPNCNRDRSKPKSNKAIKI